jgi:hypothetical protein
VPLLNDLYFLFLLLGIIKGKVSQCKVVIWDFYMLFALVSRIHLTL